MDNQDFINIPILVDVPYLFAAGQYLSRFLIELRDHGKLFGIKCPKCGRVQMPPRIVCAACHVKNGEWVEISHDGTLVGFSIVHLPLTDPTTGQPHKTPYTYGIVRLDGANSTIEHFIDVEPEIEKVWIGMRVRAILRPKAERVGDLNDILHFTPTQIDENRD